jgi:NhaB family Na+:H+ antiporter
VELIVQAVAAVFLVLGLALHVTEVGFVGLAITIVVTACNGITEEHELGDAFLEAMPFVSLLVVFFGVVAIIQDQAIFEPIIDGVLELDPRMQPGVLFVTNGARDVLSPSVKMEVGS